MEFQTKLLHGKAEDNYANGSTVPPVSLAKCFAYEFSEQLEKVFQNRDWICIYQDCESDSRCV